MLTPVGREVRSLATGNIVEHWPWIIPEAVQTQPDGTSQADLAHIDAVRELERLTVELTRFSDRGPLGVDCSACGARAGTNCLSPDSEECWSARQDEYVRGRRALVSLRNTIRWNLAEDLARLTQTATP